MAFSSETSCKFLVLHWKVLMFWGFLLRGLGCLFGFLWGFFCVVVYLFLHNSLNSSAVCCGILLLQKYLPVFLWNFNTFKLQHCLQGLLLLLAQLFMMCQNQGRPCKVTPGACRALFLPLPTNSWAVEQVKLCLHQMHILSAIRSCWQLALRALLLLS